MKKLVIKEHILRQLIGWIIELKKDESRNYTLEELKELAMQRILSWCDVIDPVE
jgi:hypothetical protein